MRAIRSEPELAVVLKGAATRNLILSKHESRAQSVHSFKRAILGDVALSFENCTALLRRICRVAKMNSARHDVIAFAMPQQATSRRFNNYLVARRNQIFAAGRRDVEPLICKIDIESSARQLISVEPLVKRITVNDNLLSAADQSVIFIGRWRVG